MLLCLLACLRGCALHTYDRTLNMYLGTCTYYVVRTCTYVEASVISHDAINHLIMISIIYASIYRDRIASSQYKQAKSYMRKQAALKYNCPSPLANTNGSSYT